MKTYLILVTALVSTTLVAAVPDVVITTLSSSNGHGTVAGRLELKPSGPVGISVRNGNLMYSTITDGDGRWGIVIRHLSTQVTATSWSLTNSSDRGSDVVASIDSLPWNSSVYASESNSSETSAKYQTETSLRYRIDSERARCRSDKGAFSYTGGFVYCNKSGNIYHCSASASCSCRKVN